MNRPHPIATMAEPTREQLERAAVSSAWLLREGLGGIERLLASDEKVDEVALGKLESFAGMAAGLSAHLSEEDNQNRPRPVTDAIELLVIAANHCEAATEHLRNHFAYRRLVSRDQGVQTPRLTEIGAKERNHSAKCAQFGRQAAHRALAKLIEVWPESYDREDV